MGGAKGKSARKRAACTTINEKMLREKDVINENVFGRRLLIMSNRAKNYLRLFQAVCSAAWAMTSCQICAKTALDLRAASEAASLTTWASGTPAITPSMTCWM